MPQQEQGSNGNDKRSDGLSKDYGGKTRSSPSKTGSRDRDRDFGCK